MAKQLDTFCTWLQNLLWKHFPAQMNLYRQRCHVARTYIYRGTFSLTIIFSMDRNKQVTQYGGNLPFLHTHRHAAAAPPSSLTTAILACCKQRIAFSEIDVTYLFRFFHLSQVFNGHWTGTFYVGTRARLAICSICYKTKLLPTQQKMALVVLLDTFFKCFTVIIEEF